MKTINSYVCEYCGKSFDNEKDCIEHEKTHCFEKEISDLAYDSFSQILKLAELSNKYGNEPVQEAFSKEIDELCKTLFDVNIKEDEDKVNSSKYEYEENESTKEKTSYLEDEIDWGDFIFPKNISPKKKDTHKEEVSYYFNGEEVSKEDFRNKIEEIMKKKVGSIKEFKESRDSSLLDYVISKL